MSMFCYQCEQTAKGKGCTTRGICGKDPETAALQDLVVHALKGMSSYAHQLPGSDPEREEADRLVLEGLFATVTNVDFDPQRFPPLLTRIAAARDRLRQLGNRQASEPTGPAAWEPAGDPAGLVAQGQQVGIETRAGRLGADLAGLQELLVYGLKGTAAYAHHALELGQQDPAVFDFLHSTLAYLADEPKDLDRLVTLNLECGRINLRAMELLDQGNTGTYGHPEPTSVRVTPVEGKAILVSGHDLKDLHNLLEQTRDKGVNVYTHGEMLPCLAYPELKKFPHLVGNYGGAWQDQQQEFAAFPGAILMTTNCIQKPAESYRDRIFTTGLVGWPGVRHLDGDDLSPLIAAAMEAPGFTADAREQRITIGFGHQAVLGVADKVIGAVKDGRIKHFFLVGGCDGAKSGRNYYTDFAKAVPDDCVILTLACGKYRFNKLDFGDIDGIPRLLDMGQCNDAYSAIKVAGALADAFGTDVNGLPLSMILSWYEQKAVCILLSLLHLGVKNIRLGPSLPAFVTPPVLQVLVDNFNIAPVGEVQADLAACLG